MPSFTELSNEQERTASGVPVPSGFLSGKRWLWIAAAAVSITTVACVWQLLAKDLLVAKRWGVVEPGRIYRSGQISVPLIKPMLAKHGIQVVIDLTVADDGNREQSAERLAISELGIQSVRYPLKGDGTGDVQNYIKAIQSLARARREGKPVLVHCSAGAQRTGGVIAAWRLLVERQPPQSVYAELQAYGWRSGKDAILLAYLNGHMQELADALKQLGIIEAVPAPLPRLSP